MIAVIVVLIRDTLALQPDLLNLGIALAYNITPKIQTVLSYNADVAGVGVFRTTLRMRGRVTHICYSNGLFVLKGEK